MMRPRKEIGAFSYLLLLMKFGCAASAHFMLPLLLLSVASADGLRIEPGKRDLVRSFDLSQALGFEDFASFEQALKAKAEARAVRGAKLLNLARDRFASDQERLFKDLDFTMQTYQHAFGGATGFSAYLNEHAISETEFREDLFEQLLVRELIEKEVAQAISLDQNRVETLVNEHSEAASNLERFRVVAVEVVPSSSKGITERELIFKQLDRVQVELMNSRSLDLIRADLVKEFGDRAKVDELSFSKGEILPELEAKLVNLKESEVSTPFETRRGYQVVQLRSRKRVDFFKSEVWRLLARQYAIREVARLSELYFEELK